jgi:ABC-type transporter Mla MlaB component
LLRIHIESTPDAVTLRLEGKLVQPWADELVKVWIDQGDGHRPDRKLRIDLSAVSFVDARGRAVLASLRRLGCELTGSGPFISAVIEDIASEPTC